MEYLLGESTGSARGDIVREIIEIVRDVANGPFEQPNPLDDGCPAVSIRDSPSTAPGRPLVSVGFAGLDQLGQAQEGKRGTPGGDAMKARVGSKSEGALIKTSIVRRGRSGRCHSSSKLSDAPADHHGVIRFQHRRKITSILIWNTLVPIAIRTTRGSCW